MGGPDLSMSNCVIIDNIPKDVPQEKHPKLHKLIYNNILNSKDMGCHVKNFELCTSKEGKTTGFALVEFENSTEAERCVTKLDGQKLDKAHVFRVCNFTAWDRYKTTPETYEEVSSVVASDSNDKIENLEDWLLDEKCREQYFIKYGDDTEVLFNDPVDIEKKERCKLFDNLPELVRWSPRGTYLVSTHPQGIQLWGGPSWKPLGRFAHKDVQLSDFSPRETFLVTWYNNLTVWEVGTGKRIRAFPGGPTPEHPWPVFKWSHDERYMARIMQDNIHICDTTNGMKLIQPDPKKNTTLYIPYVRNFEWSPTDNILAYWVPEDGDKPAKVALVKVVMGKNGVEFQNLTQKNLFRVKDVYMSWHGSGDFLGVKVDRYSKTSKAKEKVTNFELFRLRSKGQIAVDVLELTNEVIAFAWEPKGLRFAIISAAASATGCDVSFFTMGGQKEGTVKKVGTLENRQANHIFWSPKGNHVLLAGLKSMNGKFAFVNVNDMQVMSTGEHFMCTEVDWDYSGRFVSTSVSYWRHSTDTGYMIWTFQGKSIISVARDKFYRFQWRPRPPSLLTEAQIKNVQKNLKERAAQFDEEQKRIQRIQQEQIAKEKTVKLQDFLKFIKERKESMKKDVDARRACRKNCDYHSDDESVYTVREELMEEVIEVVEEEMN